MIEESQTTTGQNNKFRELSISAILPSPFHSTSVRTQKRWFAQNCRVSRLGKTAFQKHLVDTDSLYWCQIKLLFYGKINLLVLVQHVQLHAWDAVVFAVAKECGLDYFGDAQLLEQFVGLLAPMGGA